MKEKIIEILLEFFKEFTSDKKHLLGIYADKIMSLPPASEVRNVFMELPPYDFNLFVSPEKKKQIEHSLIELLRYVADNDAQALMWYVAFTAHTIRIAFEGDVAPEAPHVTADDVHPLPPDAPDVNDESIREANYKEDIGGTDSGDWCHNDDKGVDR